MELFYIWTCGSEDVVQRYFNFSSGVHFVQEICSGCAILSHYEDISVNQICFLNRFQGRVHGNSVCKKILLEKGT